VIPLALNWHAEEAVSVFSFVICDESMYVERVQCSVNDIIPGNFFSNLWLSIHESDRAQKCHRSLIHIRVGENTAN
jgi:hypothetical protein